jgi:cell division protein FtsL
VFTKKNYQDAKKQGETVADVNNYSLFNKIRKYTLLIVFIIFVFYSAKLFLHQQKQLDSLNQQKQELQSEIIDIQEQTRELEEEAIKLHDKEYIEYVARKEYGMVGEGDLVFIPAQEIGE